MTLPAAGPGGPSARVERVVVHAPGDSAAGARLAERLPAAIEAAVRALEVAGPDGDWREHLDVGRRALAAAGDRERRPRPSALLAARADPAVLDALRSWRAAAARAAGVPASMILHDATLAAVAEARPSNRDALLALPGLGATKADRYGDALLAVVARHRASA
jgi:superfamily II DNA helicase RecQ